MLKACWKFLDSSDSEEVQQFNRLHDKLKVAAAHPILPLHKHHKTALNLSFLEVRSLGCAGKMVKHARKADCDICGN